MYPTWTKRRTKKSIPCSIPLFYHFLPWFGWTKKLFHKNWCPQGGSQWFCSSEQPSHCSQLHRIGDMPFSTGKNRGTWQALKPWGCHGSMVYFVYLQWHQFMVTEMMGKFGWRTCSLRHWQRFFFWLKKIRPWWGIFLIFIFYWKDLIDFLKTILPPVSRFHITFPNGGLPGVCRVFRGECEIVHMTQQRHPVAGALKQTVWNGGTPQQIISLQFLVLKLGVSQYPSWRHPIRCKRSVVSSSFSSSDRFVCQLPAGPTALPEHMRRTWNLHWQTSGVKDLGVVIFKGKNVENPWRRTQKLVYVGKVCVYTIM